MSLDVTLRTGTPVIRERTSGIFVRENGQTKEISEEEWKIKHPDYEPIKFNYDEEETNEVYSANITHNLNTMAEAAGIYDALWRPYKLNENYNPQIESNYDAQYEFENNCVIKAFDLIEPLRNGLHKLKLEPDKYKEFNPDNGWGTYEGLVKFVEDYLNACYKYPDADVEISR